MITPTHHWHFQSVDVERADLPVAADIVDKFDQTMEPEHPRYHQDKNNQDVITNPKMREQGRFFR